MTELIKPIGDIPFVLDKSTNIHSFSLLERLDAITRETPDRYSAPTVDRVRQLVQYETKNPGKHKLYRIFEDVDDYVLYYNMHPEWHSMTSTEAGDDHRSGANAFLQAYATFINNNTQDQEDKNKLKQKFFKRMTIKWKSSYPSISDEQVGIGNIQDLFIKAFPEFDKQFPRGDDGEISMNKREDAKNYILDHIRGDNFIVVFGSACINKRAVPYFQGSRLVVIKKSFSSWGVDFREEKIINPQTKAYVDEKNVRWVSLFTFCKIHNIDPKTFSKYLVDVLIQLGRNSSHKEINLYRESELLAQLKEHAAVLLGEGGFFRANVFRKRISLHKGFNISRLLEGVTKKKEKQKDGKEILLYSESEGMAVIESFLALPKVDPATDTYTSSNHKRFATANYFRKNLGIHHTGFTKYCKSVHRMVGRIGNRRVDLYDVDEVLKILGSKYKKREDKQYSDLAISSEEAMRELEKMLE